MRTLTTIMVTLCLARLCAGVVPLPVSTGTAQITIDGDLREWKALPAVQTVTLRETPDAPAPDGPTVSLTWDKTNLFLAFACPQPQDTIVQVPISLPFSDGLWRRGDRLEWYVTVGDEKFHYVFMPHGETFRILVKPGGFEEGHAVDFIYKTKIGQDGWSGEVQIPLEDSPFPLPKLHPNWEMRFVLTRTTAKKTLVWPPSKSATETPGEIVHFSTEPPTMPSDQKSNGSKPKTADG